MLAQSVQVFLKMFVELDQLLRLDSFSVHSQATSKIMICLFNSAKNPTVTKYNFFRLTELKIDVHFELIYLRSKNNVFFITCLTCHNIKNILQFTGYTGLRNYNFFLRQEV
jgi:hypothetical protein